MGATYALRPMRLEGRKALVTGGASGIGAAIARRLSGEGAEVWIGDLNEDGAGEVAAEIGGQAVKRDVTDRESAGGAVADEREAVRRDRREGDRDDEERDPAAPARAARGGRRRGRFPGLGGVLVRDRRDAWGQRRPGNGLMAGESQRPAETTLEAGLE